MDKGHWAEKIPATRELNLYGLQIYMIHYRKLIKEDISNKDIVIYGHSHKYSQMEKDGVYFLNPGSCGPRRFHLEITMAILTIDEKDGSFVFEKVDVSPILESDGAKLSEQDMAKLIRNIMRQMDDGKMVEEISKKNRVDVQLKNSTIIQYIFTNSSNL